MDNGLLNTTERELLSWASEYQRQMSESQLRSLEEHIERTVPRLGLMILAIQRPIGRPQLATYTARLN